MRGEKSRVIEEKNTHIPYTLYNICVCVCVRQYNMIAVRAGRCGGDQLKAARAYVS